MGLLGSFTETQGLLKGVLEELRPQLVKNINEQITNKILITLKSRSNLILLVVSITILLDLL